MEKVRPSGTELTVLRRYFVMLLVLWTALVGAFLLWSLLRLKHENEEMASIQARHSVDKDLVYRRWVASRGGVYVPLSEQTPPNPYLAHVKERDITTPSGRDLTLVNPAYMTRQVYELGFEEYGIRGHMTSLNPLRPANAADAWETKALQTFEQGVMEVRSRETLDGQDYLRYMRPMTVEPACLNCHAEQGYQVGELRGGISVSVPMAPIQAIAQGQVSALAVGHFVLWLLGVGGMSLGGQRLKRGMQERTHAKAQIESLAKFPSENPNPVLRVAKNGTLLYANDASGSLLAEWNCRIDQIVPETWQQIVAEVFVSGSAQSIEMEHAGKTYAFVAVPVFDAGYVNLYGRDVSARKQAERDLQEAHNKLELRVQERTAELSKANEQLREAVTERRNTEKETHRLREEYAHIARVAAMGELTASLAHELKQPLAAIRSNAQAAQRFLASENLDLTEFCEILADIIKDNRRADDIIRKLRTLMQKGDLQIVELNINDVIREIAPLTASYEAIRHVYLEFELDERVQPVAGDRVQLQQVLLNLVLNASEALVDEDIGSRKVVVRTAQEDAHCVAVAVEDNGTGIDEQDLEHLFTPFYTTKPEGLGMGLAISRSIIEALGGRLWAQNNPVRGATFYFTIPIAKGNSA